MKKIYILLVSLLPLAAMSQITLSQTAFPAPGVGWIAKSNSSYTGVIPAGGANVTWDYSSLTGSNDTTAFRAVAGTPYAGTFTTATCATLDLSNNDWSYYEGNSTGFYFVGGNSNNGLLHFTPEWLYVPVPFTYTNNRTNVARWIKDTVVSNTNYRLIYNITSTFAADGWGTVTTPSGTYSNVLRVKDIARVIDSILIDPLKTGNYQFASIASASTTVNYRWLRNNSACPIVLEIDADSAGTTPNKSSYFSTGYVLSTNDLPALNNAFSIYPDPAADVVHINLQGKTYPSAVISIYNAIGQEVMKQDAKGMSLIELSVSKLENGIYYYSLVSDGERESGRFSVVH